MRISTEIDSCSDADVLNLAEGSIRQRPLSRGRAGIGGVPSPGHAPQGWPRNRKRAPHLLPYHRGTPRDEVGRYMQPRVDRRKHGRMLEQSYDPIVPGKVGNRRAPQGAATAPTGGKGGADVRIC